MRECVAFGLTALAIFSFVYTASLVFNHDVKSVVISFVTVVTTLGHLRVTAKPVFDNRS